jgi:predicted nucleic acid-binding protein
MTNFSICVDASLMTKLVIAEPDSQFAAALWEAWLSGGFRIYAPTLLPFEVASAIRKQVKRGTISDKSGEKALAELMKLLPAVEMVDAESYLAKAWDIAKSQDLTVVYDACYVALAESLDAQLWTGDGRMLRAMPQHAGRIRTLNPTP